MIAYGPARNHGQRRAAVERALELVDGDRRRLLVMFEQHDHMPITRGTRFDRDAHARGENGAPDRNTKSIYGMGKAYGRWLEVLEMFGIPDSQIAEVRPTVWRAPLGIRGKDEQLKKAACERASRHVGAPIKDHNVAEGVCIAEWAAWHGFARFDAERAHERIKARAKRASASQGVLALGAPENDNGGRDGSP